MSDLFISYSRADREPVERLAAALEGLGWSVWWDRRIGAGRAFDRTIEDAIRQSRLVIVVWSARSVDSDWVRAEAAYALENRKLIPVLLDDATPPLRFINTQTLKLENWRGSGDAPGLRQLANEIEEFLKTRPAPPAVDDGATTAGLASSLPLTGGPTRDAEPGTTWRGARRRSLPMVGAAVAAVLALLAAGGVGYRYMPGHSDVAAMPSARNGAAADKAAPASGPPAPAATAAGEPNKAPQPAAPVTADSKPASGEPTLPSPIGDPIYFDKGKVMLSAAARSRIEQQGLFLRQHPGVVARIEAYARAGEGPPETLRGLAELRAHEVRRALTANGIDAGRLTLSVHVDDAAPLADAGNQGPRVVVMADRGR